MGRDHYELPSNAAGRPLGSWGRIDLILRLRATTARKLLLVVIARMESRKDSECWASMRTLARDCSLSRGYIWQQIEQLEAEGIITVAGRQKGRRTMRVQICWDVVEELVSGNETCPDTLQVQPDDLDPFGPDEETCQSGLQVEDKASESCPLSLQDGSAEPETCPPGLQVESAEGVPAPTCKLVPSNLSTGIGQRVNSEVLTCHLSLHKGLNQGLIQGSREGGSRSALTRSAPPPSGRPVRGEERHQPQPAPVEKKPNSTPSADDLAPGSTLTYREIDERKRMVESIRPSWLRKPVAPAGGQ